TLNTPSAPDVRFFQRPAHPMRVLRVQAGYATQRFIPNLAQSTCFPALQELDWTEIEAIDLDEETEYNRSLYRSLVYPEDPETIEKINKACEKQKEECRPTSCDEFEA